jgi:phage-related holin
MEIVTDKAILFFVCYRGSIVLVISEIGMPINGPLKIAIKTN